MSNQESKVAGLRINEQIRTSRVRVIDPDGEQLGIMTPEEALNEAAMRNLDLVEVSPNAQPPVCRIMDYGKFRYEQSKKEKEARKNQKVVTVKEIRMGVKIDNHDFDVKAKNSRKFIESGDKVKVAIRFRGREIVHNDLAKKKLLSLSKQLEDIAVVEKQPFLEGRQMIMILAPAKVSE
jgi:translation initiation factor IF-3